MLVQEVLNKYHELVPFPWTLPKISEAGFNPLNLFLDIGLDLNKCEDNDTPFCQSVLLAINNLAKQSD